MVATVTVEVIVPAAATARVEVAEAVMIGFGLMGAAAVKPAAAPLDVELKPSPGSQGEPC